MTKRFVVYVRSGYYSADSDIAREFNQVGTLPRVAYGVFTAISASDACAKAVSLVREQFAKMKQIGYEVDATIVHEAVACTEVVPTHAELLALVKAEELTQATAYAFDELTARGADLNKAIAGLGPSLKELRKAKDKFRNANA